MISLRASLAQSKRAGELFTPPTRRFEDAVNLDGASVGHMDLRGVTFAAPFHAKGACFEGLAWFDGAVFERGADFSRAFFHQDARFDAAQFGGEALFIETEFGGVAAFDNACFARLCAFDRATAFGNLSLGAVRCAAPVSLRGVECYGGLWCEGARFADVDATGLEVHGRAYLRDAWQSVDAAHQGPALQASSWLANGDVRR